MDDRANILKQMKVCRFCLSDVENDLTSIHERLNKNSVNIPLPSLPLQIMACIAIEVVKNDNMPQYICNSCRELTTQAYIFKTNCKKADDALKLFLVTGQLSKPYMQNVVQIRVHPAAEKTITVVHHDDDTEKSQTSPSRIVEEESQMDFEEIEDNEEEDKETPIVEVLKRNKTSAEPKVKTHCYSCSECDRSFPLKQLLDIHVKNHSRERNYECDVCQSKFYTKYDLQKHVLTHNPNKEFECVVCQKSFAREPMLRRHEKIHIDAPKYVCIECDKTFLTKEYLEFHLQKHNKKKPFTCNICNKSFVFKQGLERHEIVHSENKPYKCNYCEASFTSAIKLTRHITSHAGLRPYPCKLCGRTFLLSHHLTRHMRSHYASKTSIDQVGQHKCDICSMSFRKKDSLINHSVIHSMVNLKCVICNTTFDSASNVKEHITTHLTGLPFPCEKCDYSFETSEQLEEHELKHAEMEYEDQIEKEVFSESLNQLDSEEDEVEEGEVREYTIVDVNNPESGLKSNQEEPEEMDERAVIKDFRDNFSSRVEFLKDEIDSESEQAEENAEVVGVEEEEDEDEGEEEEEEEEEEDEVEITEIQSIKPIVRQEGTKVYERKNIPSTKPVPVAEIRMSSLNEQQQQTTLPLNTEASSLKKVGDKMVKVKKFILTKDEMKAMAKKGILEVRNGQVVLKSGGHQILNATMKPMQKNEIDSLLDKRHHAGNKLQIKRYEKKVPGQDT